MLPPHPHPSPKERDFQPEFFRLFLFRGKKNSSLLEVISNIEKYWQ